MTTKVPALILAVAVACISAGAARMPRVTRGPQSQSSGGSGSGSSSIASGTAKKKAASKKRRTAKREPTQKAPTADRILEIQNSLARTGYYKGEPNGKWDANTIGAMQRFQSDNGLEPTGKLDALSLQKLGLGSSVAGVSAPRPVTHQPAPANGPSGAPPSGAPNAAPTSQPGTPRASAEGSGTETASSGGPAPASTEKAPHR